MGHSHRALMMLPKNRAKRKVGPEDASKFARHCYQEATKLYNELGLVAPVKRAKA